ncbi:hypothetical protein HX820_03590, partial [Escherichia coli]|nr:hypothetical protein [Escherichia coli]
WSTSKTPSYTKSVSWQHHPTFHQRDREDADPLINDALIYIRDECIDERKLRGESPETVIAIFNRELQNIFNQEIE